MYKLVLYILFLNFITINFAYSYIGPGMGGGFIAAIIGIVIALFSLIFGILWFPLRRLFKSKKKKMIKKSDKTFNINFIYSFLSRDN